MAQTVPDGSFETPVVGAGGYAYNPTVAGVTFTAGAGVAGNGSPFSGASAPDGVQYAFIQNYNNAAGSIAFNVTGLAAGSQYNVSFYGSQRPGYQLNPVAVSFDGTSLGTYSPTSATAFDFFTTGNFTATGTTGTLTFLGTGPTSDSDIALDNVVVHNLSAAPEPGSWALMIGGFGLVGGALRRRKSAGVLAARTA